jgi:hypothetical protein
MTFNKNDLPSLQELKKLLVLEALRRTNYNRRAASKMIGISVVQLNEICGGLEEVARKHIRHAGRGSSGTPESNRAILGGIT